ncbi:translation initiation factor IF-3 [Limnoglobus roseus]|uniref:Translation initiation factor IF-3 n=1 Tax=Limnoglobus roseus TaxID=2598579 RepID=A0A5C1A5T8_9BACT|nr:translation initiation factor IF-3 [Limnoglobus roseus]QEL13713.1 translation initiation factor IF-3 [Limnoglobus roseus]
MNEQIRISPIRLIGADAEQHGIVPTLQALEMAREAGMDLVEIVPTERPPVCKIMDYGKHKYAQSKKAHQKTHQQKLKELRVRPKTGTHDVETRLNQARGFLQHGDKVQLKVQFRGREMQHIEEGRRIIDGMVEALLEVCKVESPPRMEGKQMTALLAPKGTGAAAKPQKKPEKKPEPKPAIKPPGEAGAKPPEAATKPTDGKPPEAKPAMKPDGPAKPPEATAKPPEAKPAAPKPPGG